MAEIPDAVIRTIAVRPELLGHTGPGIAEPLGFLSGMVPPSVARASHTARAMWFESISWSCMSRLLLGLSLVPPKQKVSDEKSPNGLEPVANETMFDKRRGLAPAPPGNQSRV